MPNVTDIVEKSQSNIGKKSFRMRKTEKKRKKLPFCGVRWYLEGCAFLLVLVLLLLLVLSRRRLALQLLHHSEQRGHKQFLHQSRHFLVTTRGPLVVPENQSNRKKG
jgi:hypothetical protein